MATKIFQPVGQQSTQITRATPANVESTDVFRLLVNGATVASFAATAATVANVTAGLTAAWNASTSPYKTNITAADATTHLTLTGPAGMPFTVTSSTTDGGGNPNQTLTISSDQTMTGPNDWTTALNWGGTAPVNSDDVYLTGHATNLLWGLDQSAVTLTNLRIDESFFGHIGLDPFVYVQNADGSQISRAVGEYRQHYLKIGVSGICEIGRRTIPGEGPRRIKIDFASTAPTVYVLHGPPRSSEPGRPAVRLRFNSATATLIVQRAPGGVGIAAEKGDETSLLGTIRCMDSDAKVILGNGITLTNWVQHGGDHLVRLAATLALLKCYGGRVQTLGDFTITDLINNGADILVDHVKTGGNAVTTGRLARGRTIANHGGRSANWGTVQRDRVNAVFDNLGQYAVVATETVTDEMQVV